VAVLWNSDNPSKVAECKDTQEAASTVGLALRSVEARSRDELEVALAAIGKNAARPRRRGDRIERHYAATAHSRCRLCVEPAARLLLRSLSQASVP